MGPRLLYVLIMGTVIAAALALRVWDPSPVATLRSLAFDAYQRVSPRKFDPALPVRIIDIDEDSLKAIGHGPGRARCSPSSSTSSPPMVRPLSAST
jgi:adenylate cyclase